MAATIFKDDKAEPPAHSDLSQSPTRDSHDIVNVQGGDLLDLKSADTVLNVKMRLVNDTIYEIGFTGYQAKLFMLNVFGYINTSVSIFRRAQCDGGYKIASYATTRSDRFLLGNDWFSLAPWVLRSRWVCILFPSISRHC